jgi:uncharacterized protein YkwD
MPGPLPPKNIPRSRQQHSSDGWVRVAPYAAPIVVFALCLTAWWIAGSLAPTPRNSLELSARGAPAQLPPTSPRSTSGTSAPASKGLASRKSAPANRSKERSSSSSSKPSQSAVTTTSATTTAQKTPSPASSATTAKPSTQNSTSTVEAEVLRLVNLERAQANCRPLQADEQLALAARRHSADQAANGYFDHTSQDGRTWADRIAATSYQGRPGGENIAAGQPTPAAVMDSWMKSPGHRANILNCSFKDLGVGVARGGSYGIYWTQDFGS